MKIGDILYFSPKFKFIDLEFENEETLIKAFDDRVRSLYLEPSYKLLDKEEFAFAVGLICVSMIDLLARISSVRKAVGDRYEKWILKNIPELVENMSTRHARCMAKLFYEDFRCGLVHEGRIKNCGQFSYDIDSLAIIEEDIMLVNPKKLLESVERAFANYLEEIKTNENSFREFRDALKRDFGDDVALAKEVDKREK
jgi:hypothetical protein